MKRKVYLVGEIEKLFGSEFSMYADNYGEIIRNIDCNRPGFKRYLLECDNRGIGFTINFAGKGVEEKELLTPIKEGDVTIAAVPAGSKSEMGMILTGIALIALSFVPGMAPWASQMLIGIGSSLALQGIQAMLAPDPATDAEEEEGYLYTGSEAIVVEGDPVPVLYGKLRVPGQPVSVAINTAGSLSNFSGSGFGFTGESSGGSAGLDDCFDPDTFIQMADGSEKKIKYIKLGDNTKGGEVTGVFQFKTSVDEMHDYKGVTVAGSHFVKENFK